LPLTSRPEEIVVNQPDPAARSDNELPATPPSWTDAIGRIGVDWWATIVAGAIAVLAATDLLPKIPW
jgi:hypothetical protein